MLKGFETIAWWDMPRLATEGKVKEAITAATKIPRIAPLSEVQNVFRSGRDLTVPGTSELTNSPDWGYSFLYITYTISKLWSWVLLTPQAS